MNILNGEIFNAMLLILNGIVTINLFFQMHCIEKLNDMARGAEINNKYLRLRRLIPNTSCRLINYVHSKQNNTNPTVVLYSLTKKFQMTYICSYKIKSTNITRGYTITTCNKPRRMKYQRCVHTTVHKTNKKLKKPSIFK